MSYDFKLCDQGTRTCHMDNEKVLYLNKDFEKESELDLGICVDRPSRQM